MRKRWIKNYYIIAALAVSLIQGFLSMGFQIVGSRLLYPYFGSTVVVWAFLISTFLFSFSSGAFLGGYISRLRSGRYIIAVVVFLIGAIFFWIVPLAGKQFLAVLSQYSFYSGLFFSCLALFLLPVVAMSAILPLIIEVVSENGVKAGMASGLIFGTSTLGNICGVMVTAFYLIPNFGVSSLTFLWACLALVCFLSSALLLYRATRSIIRNPNIKI